MTLAFFYGSLREGYWNNKKWLSTDARKVGDAQLDNFKLCVGNRTNVPCIVPEEGAVVRGELWELTEADAQNVDYLETGYLKGSSVFNRQELPLDATFYYQTKPSKCAYLSGGWTHIQNGDYTTYIGPDGNKL